VNRLTSCWLPVSPPCRYQARNSTVPSAASNPPSVVASTSRPVQRTVGSSSSDGGRVEGCQVSSRYAGSPTAKALYRERISCSAVPAVAVPSCNRPQHSA
jgi:hypothetical protein